MTLRASGHWLGTRAGAGRTATLAWSFFWPHPMAPWTAAELIRFFSYLFRLINFSVLTPWSCSLRCTAINHTTRCNASSNPNGRGIFGQYMELVPTQHHKFGQLLICSSNPNLESQKQLGNFMCQPHITLNWILIFLRSPPPPSLGVSQCEWSFTFACRKVEVGPAVIWQALAHNGL